MRKIVLSLLFGMIVSAVPLLAQSKEELREEKTQQIREMVERKDYRIEVNRAIPMQMPSVHLTTVYSLTIKNDSIDSYLPYYGRAYTAAYGQQENLRFEAVMKSYDVKFKKKGKIEVNFSVRTKEDSFRYKVEIQENGSTTIFVQPVNKQAITFYGEFVVEE